MIPFQHDIDAILKTAPDPLGIRTTTALVVRNSQLASLNRDKLKKFSQILNKRIQERKLLTETQFSHSALSPQLVFIQDAINFCFWAKKGQPKWTVEYPAGVVHNGWYALTACFERANAEGIPILDVNFLESITETDVRHILRGKGQSEAPLLNERTAILREVGKILNRHFAGLFDNILKQANNDAPQIARTIITRFPSFNDFSILKDKTINFQKRAQLCAYDLSLLPTLRITNTDHLTAFADYKLPQILRSF